MESFCNTPPPSSRECYGCGTPSTSPERPLKRPAPSSSYDDYLNAVRDTYAQKSDVKRKLAEREDELEALLRQEGDAVGKTGEAAAEAARSRRRKTTTLKRHIHADRMYYNELKTKYTMLLVELWHGRDS